MTEVIFRPARRADVPAVVGLLADDEFGRDREAADGEVDAAYWAAFDAIDSDGRNVLIVAEEAGEVVATMQLTFIPSLTRRGGERAEIEGVRVRADRRGAGLGRQLITWAVRQATERGCRLVQLTSDKRRTKAHRFYTSLGFESTHEGMKLSLPGTATAEAQ